MEKNCFPKNNIFEKMEFSKNIIISGNFQIFKIHIENFQNFQFFRDFSDDDFSNFSKKVFEKIFFKKRVMKKTSQNVLCSKKYLKLIFFINFKSRSCAYP